MPTRDPLDPRLYGLAPVTSDAHNGEVLWTILGVMQYLGVKSETTIRGNPELMAMRRVISPGVVRWVPDEVKAYVMAKKNQPVKLTKAQQHRLSGEASKSFTNLKARAWEQWQKRTKRQYRDVPDDRR